MRSGNRRHAKVDDCTDHDDIADRAETRSLPQRNPKGQHDRADDYRPGSNPKPEPAREALVQHIPGIDAQARQQHEGVAEAVERQAGVELSEAAQAGRRHRGTIAERPREPVDCGAHAH